MSGDEAMNLDAEQAEALALRVVARHVWDVDDWLMWEDYPELGEHAFDRLVQAVREVSSSIHRAADACDDRLAIDSRHLMECVQ